MWYDPQPHVLLRRVNILFRGLEIWPKKSFSDIKRCRQLILYCKTAPTKPSELTCKKKHCENGAKHLQPNLLKIAEHTTRINKGLSQPTSMRWKSWKNWSNWCKRVEIHGQHNALQRILYPTMYCSLIDLLFPTVTIFKHLYFAKSIFKQNWIKIHLFLRW